MVQTIPARDIYQPPFEIETETSVEISAEEDSFIGVRLSHTSRLL